MKVQEYISSRREERPLHFTLLDPGKTSSDDLITLARQTAEAGTDGNDAEAEAIEKETGFSFLGVSTNAYSEERKCIISGRPTNNRVFLAKSF